MYGALTVICGPMMAGKTTELLKRIFWARNGLAQAVLVVKPAFDNRYDSVKIVSHDGAAVDAKAIQMWGQVKDLAADADLICIDEIQFFKTPHFEGDIVQIIGSLLKQGKEIVVTGLDMDWRGEPFANTSSLMAMADTLLKLSANCTLCGQKATKTYKKTPNEEQIELGSDDLYEARCNKHWPSPYNT